MIDVLLVLTDKQFLLNHLQHKKRLPLPALPFDYPTLLALCSPIGSHIIAKVSYGQPLQTLNQKSYFSDFSDDDFYRLVGGAKMAIDCQLLEKRPIKIPPSLWTIYPDVTTPILVSQSTDYNLINWGNQQYNPRPHKPTPQAAKGLLSGTFY